MIGIDADADAAARERAWAAACEAALPSALRDALEAARRLDDGIDAASIWLAACDCADEGEGDAIAAAERRARSVARSDRREGGKRGPKFFLQVEVEEGEGYDLAEALPASDIFGADPIDLLIAQQTIHAATGGGLPLPMPAASACELAKKFGTTPRRQQQRERARREQQEAGQLDLLFVGAEGEA
ncbi:MAG: hypothetical protein M0Z99_00505 [Betaproteobacteria bacterium]|nr:hypothetical protein [Betaproteobacteria bacterium]